MVSVLGIGLIPSPAFPGFGRVARTTVESGQGTPPKSSPVRLTVRTLGFHPRNRGSIPLRGTTMGRRSMVGHRFLAPAMRVRLLPPQPVCWLLCFAHAFFFLSCSACGGRGVSLPPCRAAGRRRRTRRSAPRSSSPDHIPNRDLGQRVPAATLSRSLPRPTCCSR